MKILFLHYSYPGVGGTETVTNLLAQYFTEYGHKTLVLAWQHPVKTVDCNPAETIYLPDKQDINSTENAEFIFDFLKSNDVDCIINQGPFWIPTKQIKQSKTAILSVLHYAPDYKIVNQLNAIAEEFRRKSPTLIHFIKSTVRYCFKGYFARRDFNRIFKVDLHNTITNSDRFVLLCDEYRNQLEKLLQRTYNNLAAIGNGLETCKKFCGKSNTIVCVGRLTKWDKRIDRLLKIWSRIETFPPLFVTGNCRFLGTVPTESGWKNYQRNFY